MSSLSKPNLNAGPAPMSGWESVFKSTGENNTLQTMSQLDRNILYWMVEKSWLFQLKYKRGPIREELKKHGRGDHNYIGDANIDKWYDTDEYYKAAYYRGIRWAENGVDERQHLLLSVLADITDNRTITQKLRALNIRSSEYQAWLELPEFQRLYSEFTERAKKNAQLAIENVLTQAAVGGNLNAIKYWDQRTGTFDPDRQKNVDVMAVLQGTVEIIIKHVKDPELRAAIANDLQLMATSQVTGNGLNLGASYGSNPDNTTRVIEAGGG